MSMALSASSNEKFDNPPLTILYCSVIYSENPVAQAFAVSPLCDLHTLVLLTAA